MEIFDKLPRCVRRVLAESDYTAPTALIFQQWKQHLAAGFDDHYYAARLKNKFESIWREKKRQMFSDDGEEDIV